ncbi:MAG: hypothetical protein K2M98_02715, partial [Muribaculum sp.]|nr:hypothetical protein [Muribaculum sp.]
MNIKLPARLIELFGLYRQLNSVLDDNWRDVASKDFFSNFVDPVNSSWKTFHRQTEDASMEINRLNDTTESEENQLRKAIEDIHTQLYHSPLRGEMHYSVHADSGSVDILIPEKMYRVTQDDDLLLEYVQDYV